MGKRKRRANWQRSLFMRYSDKIIKAARSNGLNMRSLNDFPLDELSVAYELSQDPIDILECNEIINGLLRTLSERESEIIKRHFGIDQEASEDFGEIARILELSKNEVRRIYKQSMRKLDQPSRRVELEKLL